MSEWWSSLETVAQIYWTVALSATAVLLVQTILMFMGADVESDVDTDFGDFEHGTGLHPLSIRGVLGALTGFGWGGISALSMGASTGVSIGIGFGCAFVFMMTVAYLMAFFHSLAASGTLEISNAVGTVGSVYVAIPANRSGAGQVTVVVQGQQRQIRAVTDCDDALKAGVGIKVIETLPDHSVLVDRV